MVELDKQKFEAALHGCEFKDEQKAATKMGKGDWKNMMDMVNKSVAEHKRNAKAIEINRKRGVFSGK